ncbi:endo-1,4-beta-xylanase [Kineococcus sp. SYSU DK005]|uniref:endo-1,4-beta-xylanase n=1 Tax=Kineococcus sp. SYSU DK005 TaxID=3383126 RepID=UPI003D7EA0A8
MKAIRACTSALAVTALAAAVLTGSSPLASAAGAAPGNPGLKDVYEDHFLVGTTISPDDWTASGGAKWAHMLKHFNAVTPENALKPDSIWSGDPVTGQPAGAPTGLASADSLLTRANEAGFYTIGHALAWHNQSRYWPARSADRNTLTSDMTIHWDHDEARSRLRDYIHTIAGRYSEGPAALDAWDVVNEAMRDNPENPTDWRNALRSLDQPKYRAAAWAGAYARGGNPWDYVYDSFVFAREADPDAVLYYNDFNDLELPNKAIAIASMVTELNERYAREHPEDGEKLIQGIGIQAHYNTRLDLGNLERNLQTYIATGVEVSLTELDLSITGTQDSGETVPPSDEQLQVQADKYAELFLLLKRYSDHIARVSFWGTSDSNSWRSSFFPLPFSRSGDTWTEKPAYHAVVDPEGWLGFDEERPELTSFTYGGEVFEVDPRRTEYDVHVPDDVRAVDFSADDVAHRYGDDVEVEVSPGSGECAVGPGDPCVVTVTVARVDEPANAATYTISFGHMSAEWEQDVQYPDTGYRSAVDVRFSDGSSDLTLFQEFLRDGRPVVTTSEEHPAPPKHGSARFTISTDDPVSGGDPAGTTVRKHVWDQDWAPLTAARVTDLGRPQSTWRAADSIEGDETYLVVAGEDDAAQALTHEGLDPVPAGGGVSEARQGYYGTPVVVDGDAVVEPEPVQDNMRWLFTEAESSDPGPYTRENGYRGFTMMSLVHGGLIQPFTVHRADDPDRVNTDALVSDKLIGDENLDRAVWFDTGLDEDGATTLFTHSAGSGETYALHGSGAGFVAEGGRGELDQYADASRVRLFESVTERTFEETDRLGVGIEPGAARRVVDGSGVHHEVPVAADVPDGRQAVLLRDGTPVATATFAGGRAVLRVAESDVEAGARYVLVVRDDADVLGAAPLPAGHLAVPVTVEASSRGVVNPGSRGTLEVTLLSQAGFDPVQDVDVDALRVGVTGTEDSVVGCWAGRDVDRDGVVDLDCAVRVPLTGVRRGDTRLLVTGSTVGGTALEAAVTIRTVPWHRGGRPRG